MSNDIKEKVLNEMSELFEATDNALNEWAGEGNLQFPVLFGMIAMKLNLDEKQVKEMDPFVRKYVRSHPEWYVTRGAHGGIMKASDKQKKEAAKEAKDLAKKQMQEALEAKVASQNVSRDPSDTE
jgi:hypothetical protein